MNSNELSYFEALLQSVKHGEKLRLSNALYNCFKTNFINPTNVILLKRVNEVDPMFSIAFIAVGNIFCNEAIRYLTEGSFSSCLKILKRVRHMNFHAHIIDPLFVDVNSVPSTTEWFKIIRSLSFINSRSLEILSEALIAMNRPMEALAALIEQFKYVIHYCRNPTVNKSNTNHAYSFILDLGILIKLISRLSGCGLQTLALQAADFGVDLCKSDVIHEARRLDDSRGKEARSAVKLKLSQLCQRLVEHASVLFSLLAENGSDENVASSQCLLDSVKSLVAKFGRPAEMRSMVILSRFQEELEVEKKRNKIKHRNFDVDKQQFSSASHPKKPFLRRPLSSRTPSSSSVSSTTFGLVNNMRRNSESQANDLMQLLTMTLSPNNDANNYVNIEEDSIRNKNAVAVNHSLFKTTNDYAPSTCHNKNDPNSEPQHWPNTLSQQALRSTLSSVFFWNRVRYVPSSSSNAVNDEFSDANVDSLFQKDRLNKMGSVTGGNLHNTAIFNVIDALISRKQEFILNEEEGQHINHDLRNIFNNAALTNCNAHDDVSPVDGQLALLLAALIKEVETPLAYKERPGTLRERPILLRNNIDSSIVTFDRFQLDDDDATPNVATNLNSNALQPLNLVDIDSLIMGDHHDNFNSTTTLTNRTPKHVAISTLDKEQNFLQSPVLSRNFNMSPSEMNLEFATSEDLTLTKVDDGKPSASTAINLNGISALGNASELHYNINSTNAAESSPHNSNFGTNLIMNKPFTINAYVNNSNSSLLKAMPHENFIPLYTASPRSTHHRSGSTHSLAYNISSFKNSQRRDNFQNNKSNNADAIHYSHSQANSNGKISSLEGVQGPSNLKNDTTGLNSVLNNSSIHVAHEKLEQIKKTPFPIPKRMISYQSTSKMQNNLRIKPSSPPSPSSSSVTEKSFRSYADSRCSSRSSVVNNSGQHQPKMIKKKPKKDLLDANDSSQFKHHPLYNISSSMSLDALNRHGLKNDFSSSEIPEVNDTKINPLHTMFMPKLDANLPLVNPLKQSSGVSSVIVRNEISSHRADFMGENLLSLNSTFNKDIEECWGVEEPCVTASCISSDDFYGFSAVQENKNEVRDFNGQEEHAVSDIFKNIEVIVHVENPDEDLTLNNQLNTEHFSVKTQNKNLNSALDVYSYTSDDLLTSNAANTSKYFLKDDKPEYSKVNSSEKSSSGISLFFSSNPSFNSSDYHNCGVKEEAILAKKILKSVFPLNLVMDSASVTNSNKKENSNRSVKKESFVNSSSSLWSDLVSSKLDSVSSAMNLKQKQENSSQFNTSLDSDDKYIQEAVFESELSLLYNNDKPIESFEFEEAHQETPIHSNFVSPRMYNPSQPSSHHYLPNSESITVTERDANDLTSVKSHPFIAEQKTNCEGGDDYDAAAIELPAPNEEAIVVEDEEVINNILKEAMSKGVKIILHHHVIPSSYDIAAMTINHQTDFVRNITSDASDYHPPDIFSGSNEELVVNSNMFEEGRGLTGKMLDRNNVNFNNERLETRSEAVESFVASTAFKEGNVSQNIVNTSRNSLAGSFVGERNDPQKSADINKEHSIINSNHLLQNKGLQHIIDETMDLNPDDSDASKGLNFGVALYDEGACETQSKDKTQSSENTSSLRNCGPNVKQLYGSSLNHSVNNLNVLPSLISLNEEKDADSVCNLLSHNCLTAELSGNQGFSFNPPPLGQISNKLPSTENLPLFQGNSFFLNSVDHNKKPGNISFASPGTPSSTDDGLKMKNRSVFGTVNFTDNEVDIDNVNLSSSLGKLDSGNAAHFAFTAASSFLPLASRRLQHPALKATNSLADLNKEKISSNQMKSFVSPQLYIPPLSSAFGLFKFHHLSCPVPLPNSPSSATDQKTLFPSSHNNNFNNHLATMSTRPPTQIGSATGVNCMSRPVSSASAYPIASTRFHSSRRQHSGIVNYSNHMEALESFERVFAVEAGGTDPNAVFKANFDHIGQKRDKRKQEEIKNDILVVNAKKFGVPSLATGQREENKKTIAEKKHRLHSGSKSASLHVDTVHKQFKFQDQDKTISNINCALSAAISTTLNADRKANNEGKTYHINNKQSDEYHSPSTFVVPFNYNKNTMPLEINSVCTGLKRGIPSSSPLLPLVKGITTNKNDFLSDSKHLCSSAIKPLEIFSHSSAV